MRLILEQNQRKKKQEKLRMADLSSGMQRKKKKNKGIKELDLL